MTMTVFHSLEDEEHNVEEVSHQFQVLREPLLIVHHHLGQEKRLLTEGGAGMARKFMLEGGILDKQLDTAPGSGYKTTLNN